MFKSQEIRRSAVKRLRELFPRAGDWHEELDIPVGLQRADAVLRFRMGAHQVTMALGVAPAGQPREIRGLIPRLGEIRRALGDAYAVAVAPYVSPQSAALLRGAGLGYVDLSGNCSLAFGDVIIEKEGKLNVRPSTRPLRALFAPRATRVVRVLLAEPARAWRLEELARAAIVSLGHAHNVVKRLEDPKWVERGEQHRIQLAKPGDLLEAWAQAYSYRVNEIEAWFSPERVTRKLMGDVARVAQGEGRLHAFTLHSGAALVAPNVRFPAIHAYVEGDPAPLASALGLRPAEGEGNVYLLTPYDMGVFHAPIIKGGVPVVCLPQLYADLYHYERRGREQAAHLRRAAMGY
jgi:hypothetical protein